MTGRDAAAAAKEALGVAAAAEAAHAEEAARSRRIMEAVRGDKRGRIERRSGKTVLIQLRLA